MRNWFVLHFLTNVLFSEPLFVAPQVFLGALGFDPVDPLMSRLVAAVVIGVDIGLQCSARTAPSRSTEKC